MFKCQYPTNTVLDFSPCKLVLVLGTFKEFHTSLFLVLSALKNFYIDPSIEFKLVFWLVCGKYTLGIETGLQLIVSNVLISRMVLARGWYTTGKVFFSVQGHKLDYIPCACLYATPSLVRTFGSRLSIRCCIYSSPQTDF